MIILFYCNKMILPILIRWFYKMVIFHRQPAKKILNYYFKKNDIRGRKRNFILLFNLL